MTLTLAACSGVVGPTARGPEADAGLADSGVLVDAGTPEQDGGRCGDTWEGFGQPFLATTCISCHVHDHSSFSTEAGVRDQRARITSMVTANTMPQGQTLSAPEKARLLTFLSCLTEAPPTDGGVDGGAPDSGIPFEAASVHTAVTKVKSLLVGLPPTEAEVQAVTQSSAALEGLIDGWMTRPEYEAKMRVFFELAFQQTQIDQADFNEIAPPNGLGKGAGVRLLTQNARESFARTALQLIAEGRPFTETFTTHRVMMTPAMKELYAFIDSRRADNDRKVTDTFKLAYPGAKISLSATSGPVPLEQSTDPTNPNFLHFFDPDVGTLDPDPDCNVDPAVIGADGFTVHTVLYGEVPSHKGKNGKSCRSRIGTAQGIQLSPDDFARWAMVTVRQPAQGEATTRFFDLPSLRTASELVLLTPRAGFFSTPSFQANWPTNQANQMRVTANQALIVATGMDVNVLDPTVVTQTPGLDQAHAGKAECYSCHRLLDPTRSIFSSSWSWYDSPQVDPQWAAQKGLFAFQGVVASVTSLESFGATLASHPLVATAWVQKLCFYANSAPCAADDPEFQRVVTAFTSSNFSWPTLVRTLFASPMLTNLAPTTTAATNGEVLAVARRDHFCAALDSRLGLSDACGLELTLGKKAGLGSIGPIISGMPSDGYGRGATVPILPNDPTLFYRAGLENVCVEVARLVIDSPFNGDQPNSKRWHSTDPDSAITDFVDQLMGLTASDPRTTQVKTLLRSHYTTARASQSASDALKSTFITACLSPSLLGIGL